MYYVVSIKLLM